MAAAW